MPARTSVGFVVARCSLVLVGLLLLLGCMGDRVAVRSWSKELGPAQRAPHSEDATQARLREAYGRLPMSFEANQGQTDEPVRFLSRGNGYSVFLTPTEAVFALREPATQNTGTDTDFDPVDRDPQGIQPSSAVMRMALVGANPPAQITGLEPLPGRSNYFRGNDSSQWRTDVPTYRSVRYTNVYPGVDLVYHGNQQQLEHDFVVRPGADAGAIRMRFDGLDDLRLDANGDLLMRVGSRDMRQQRPTVYQDVDGGREVVASEYTLSESFEVGFKIEGYDKRRPLIIDPVLLYSTYLGGSEDDAALGIAVDPFGNAYVTGTTRSLNFPTAHPLQPDLLGVFFDVFITKVDPTGSALVYSTFLGGHQYERGLSIAADAFGNAYVTGETNSPDFPTTANAVQRVFRGPCDYFFPCSYLDAFVVKLNATGSALVYSTYLGGTGSWEVGNGIAVDAGGNVYVTGAAGCSLDFSTPNAFQPVCHEYLFGDRLHEAFVAKINARGSALYYVTYLGGSAIDVARSVAADGEGSAYVAGWTASTDFPTANPLHSVFAGGDSDGFVTKVNADGTALVYSTYLGGTSFDGVSGVALDRSENAYVTGTNSACVQQQPVGGDLFVAKLNPTASAFVYFTCLGGSMVDVGSGIAVDAFGNAYVTGSTQSADFPTVNEIPPCPPWCPREPAGFVLKLNPAGSELIYSMFLGGSGIDSGNSIAVDSAGNAYVAGNTLSTDFPTVRPIQATHGGSTDGFIVRIGDPSCGQDVTDSLDLFPFVDFEFLTLRLQWVLVHNKTPQAISGPLELAVDDLQDAAVLRAAGTTTCLSPAGTPFVLIYAGADADLRPNEYTFAFVALIETSANPATYTPRVLSGILTQ